MRKRVALVRVLEAIVILLPVIYGLNIYRWDIGKFITPTYIPPKIDFSIGEINSFLKDDIVFLNISMSNSGETAINIEEFNLSIAYKNTIIGEAYLDSPSYIETGKHASILLVVEITNPTPLIYATENETLDLNGDLTLKLRGADVKVPFSTTIQVKALAQALLSE